MPTYVKFMKELLTRKRSFINENTIELEVVAMLLFINMGALKIQGYRKFYILVSMGAFICGQDFIGFGGYYKFNVFGYAEKYR